MKKLTAGIFLIAGLCLVARAEDCKRSPEVMAKECTQRAADFLKEAKSLEERAAKSTGAEADKIKKFADLTRQEAEALAKAGKAWANNQIRLAENHFEKASDLCEKRSKMAPTIKSLCEPPADCEKMPNSETKPACEPKAGPEKPGKPEPAGSKSELEKLEEQLQGLGKKE